MKDDARQDMAADWLETLEEEDLGFLKRFLLSSGSLKQLAKEYGVSYPTIRLRLDRLIAKVEVADQHRNSSAFERLARTRYVEGRMDFETLKELLDAHRSEVQDDARKETG